MYILNAHSLIILSYIILLCFMELPCSIINYNFSAPATHET